MKYLIAALSVLLAQNALAEATPTQVGSCVETQVEKVGHRFDDVPDSGSYVSFTNGLGQIGYEEVLPIQKSRKGDKVIMCLVALPENCPAGDDRGKVYSVINLETMETWSLADSTHSCGGA